MPDVEHQEEDQDVVLLAHVDSELGEFDAILQSFEELIRLVRVLSASSNTQIEIRLLPRATLSPLIFGT